MRLFNTVSIEITSTCNRSCKFCPVAYNSRPDERMKWRLFKKCIDELETLKYKGRIEFYIYNEPMRDMDYLLQCLDYARRKAVRAVLMIATNGDYLRKQKQVNDMYAAGLNQLLVNCYSPGLFEKRQKWIDWLPEGTEVDGSVYSAMSARKRVFKMEDKSNPETFGTGVFSLVNRAGNIPEFMEAVKEPLEKMCVKPFRLLNIDWNGNALVCCQDYHADMSFSNVTEASLVQIWNHPVMNTYRKRLLNKDRSLPICSECDCHSGAYPHNVDDSFGPTAPKSSLKELYQQRKTSRLGKSDNA